MESLAKLELERTLGVLPQSACVLASAFEGKRCGLLIRRVVQCADEPVCIAAAVPKGHRISTYIRDSHAFCLNVLGSSNRLIQRRFDGYDDTDPFDMLDVTRLVTGAPVLSRAVAAIDCEVMRRFDLEADYEIYIGQVVAARLLNPPSVAGVDSLPLLPIVGLELVGANGHANGNGSLNGNGHTNGRGHAGQNGHANGHTNGTSHSIGQTSSNGNGHHPRIAIPSASVYEAEPAGMNGYGLSHATPGPIIELPRPGKRGRKGRPAIDIGASGSGSEPGATSTTANTIAAANGNTSAGTAQPLSAEPLVSPIDDFFVPNSGPGPGGLGNLGPQVFDTER